MLSAFSVVSVVGRTLGIGLTPLRDAPWTYFKQPESPYLFRNILAHSGHVTVFLVSTATLGISTSFGCPSVNIFGFFKAR